MTIEQSIAEAVRLVVREEVRAALREVRPAVPGQLLTVEQAADLVGISVATMRRRIRSGDVPVSRIGRAVRVNPADLPRSEAQVIQLAHEARFPK